jgi:16S rRNA (guanine1207-N2)-methyltransferase
MPNPRLTTALSNGALVLPTEGRIAVLRPSGDLDLGALPKERLHLIQGFRPDFETFEAMGYDVAIAPEGRYGATVVCMTRSKAEARALVAQARAMTDGPIIVDGQKTDGIESMLRDIKTRTSIGEVISKAHGKLFVFGGGDFTDWAANPVGQQVEGGFVTRSGVFSADGIDRGSALLAQALPEKLPKRIADLGAGWGYLSRAILERAGVEQLHLVEAEHAALDCARLNITDPRAQFHWADATQFRVTPPLDAVVMNPPFHTSRAAEPNIGRAFIAAAAAMLSQRGQMWLVANRHLPYEAETATHFLEVEEIAGDRSFKVLLAAKPRRTRR